MAHYHIALNHFFPPRSPVQDVFHSLQSQRPQILFPNTCSLPCILNTPDILLVMSRQRIRIMWEVTNLENQSLEEETGTLNF